MDAEAIFKKAWHEADERGEVGGRVAAGLNALEEAGLITRKTGATQIEQRMEAIGHLTNFLIRHRWSTMNAGKLAEEIVDHSALVWLDSDKAQLREQIRVLREARQK